ncbi:MAG: phosphopyruvate hydratase [Bacilli bacterium]|nr:phosphopyruvate hydratase [Bacilli bacterium]MBQ8902066.1 phosphopyruvate hydratase [Bacilli bacterium]
MNIKDIHAREILDSRGNPTVEVEMILANNISAVASVPSGASTGSKEALELRDNDASRYLGKGVLKAVENVNTTIRKALIGQKLDQVNVDKILLKLDGTPNKSNLGANAMLAVSLCCLKCLAKLQDKELYEYVTYGKVSLPIPMINIINGGAHADNNLDVQEFMIVPIVKGEANRVRSASEIFHTLKKILKERGLSTGVGDEGGFAPNLGKTTEALDLIMDAINEANYRPGKDVLIALDVAASEMYDKNKNVYKIDGTYLNANDLIKYYIELIRNYPIISIEDPFEENDLESLAVLTKLVGDKVMLVGDDYFCTNNTLLEAGIKINAGNAILLKANQIGTVSEMTKTIMTAKKNNYKTIISHRSGETEDTFIADLAVGFGIPFIKTGSVCRGERIAKYNRLMKIEELLNK